MRKRSNGLRRWLRRALAGLAALAAVVVVLAIFPPARRLAVRVVSTTRAAVSDWRRDQRERRAALRLGKDDGPAATAPDERLGVAERVLGVEQGLGSGWVDLGWSRHDLAPGRAASLDLSSFGGLLLSHTGPLAPLGGLLLRYRAPERYGDFLEVRLEDAQGRPLPRVRLPRSRSVLTPDGAREAWIPMHELAPGGTSFERLALYAWRQVPSEPVLVEEVAFTAAGAAKLAPPRPASFTVDCRAAGRPISPLVYGIGTYFKDEGPQQWTMGATARRWGGNHASRYNWKVDAWNMDRDWYWRNVPVRSASSFLEENRRRGVGSTLTIPTLGWVAKDTTSYSFPVSRLGPQQSFAFDLPDAGNGVRQDGTPIPSPPPTVTSVACPPECVEEWVRSLRRVGQGGTSPVEAYILDNEPALWNGTHRDVHPEPLGYDELLERTIAYATAIRRADPDARIAGPAEWGWLNFHYSAKDIAAGKWMHPDRLAHGNVPLLPWYLRELRRHEERTGTRMLDLVDVHFYPAADVGVGTGGATDPAAAAMRIRSTRALWDPTYVDESWIDEPVRLLPLLREWIAENYPGRAISLGEWSFGAEQHMSGALATAEALGRFGTEGIHSAYHWTYPPDRSPTYWAFRAYRDFDGKGGRFLDTSVPVTVAGDLASLFASRDGDRVVAVLLNFSPGVPLDAVLRLEGCGPVASSRVLVYTGGADGFRSAPAPSTDRGGLRIDAPPYSITVIDLTVSPSPQPRGAGP